MNNLNDLNIEQEVLPLFDYSLNVFTKNKILEILQKPLKSTEEITERQNTLKGYSLNGEILNDYSYTVLYLNEVYYFLKDEKIDDLSQKKLKYILFGSQQAKTRYVSKFNQLILFFHRLESKYFARL